MSAALIPLTIAPFAAGSLNPIMDAILCAGIIIHSHIGFQYDHSFVCTESDILMSSLTDQSSSTTFQTSECLKFEPCSGGVYDWRR